MKAQTYSLIAVLMAIPLMLFIAYYITGSQVISSGAFEKVVSDQIHQVQVSIEEDFVRGAEIAGKRALLAADNHVVMSGEKLASADAALRELMLDGTLLGNFSIIMENNTLEEWKKSILAVPTGFNTALNFSGTAIQNHDGFRIKVGINLVTNVSDKQGIARVDKSDYKEVLVSLEGLEDPIFPLNTLGYVRREIKKYPYPFYAQKIVTGVWGENCTKSGVTGNVTFNETDSNPWEKILVTHSGAGISGFRAVVAETGDLPGVECYIVSAAGAVNEISTTINQTGYQIVYLDNKTSSVWSLPIREGIEQGYYYSGNGPDILGRLEGKLTETPNSLETFVSVPELISFGIPVKEDQTRTAYLYFSNQTINGDTVRGLPGWFRIDSAGAVKYNLTELMG